MAFATQWCEENPDTSCIKTEFCTCTGQPSREVWFVLVGVFACCIFMMLYVCCQKSPADDLKSSKKKSAVETSLTTSKSSLLF